MGDTTKRPATPSPLDNLDFDEEERDSFPTPVSCMASSAILAGVGALSAVGGYFIWKYHLIERSTKFFKEVLNYF